MGELVIPTGPQRSIQQRVKFLAGLFLNPKFYRIISDVLGDPSKLDSTLGTLCYFTLFLSAILKRSPQLCTQVKKLWIQILKTINRLLGMITKSTKLIKLNIPTLRIPTENPTIEEYNTKLYTVLKGFSGYLTDIRIFHRGFSIPACIADMIEAKSLLKDKDYLNFVSTWCISLYQPCETIAFLFDHNWLLPDREANNCNWWYAVSTRFWFAWVIAEFSQLSYRMFVTKKGRQIEKGELIGFIEHLATLPLCVHWSLEDGCLDDIYVGFLGTIAGGLSTSDMWREIWQNVLKECM